MKIKRGRIGRAGKEEREFLRWAKRATAGMDESASMISAWDFPENAEHTTGWYICALQVGCILASGKPLLVVVPEGGYVPDGIRRAAAALEFYVPGNTDSMHAAALRAFTKVGLVVKH